MGANSGNGKYFFGGRVQYRNWIGYSLVERFHTLMILHTISSDITRSKHSRERTARDSDLHLSWRNSFFWVQRQRTLPRGARMVGPARLDSSGNDTRPSNSSRTPRKLDPPDEILQSLQRRQVYHEEQATEGETRSAPYARVMTRPSFLG